MEGVGEAMKIFACSSVWQMADGGLKQSLNICNARIKEEAMGIHIGSSAYKDTGTMGGILCVEWIQDEKDEVKHG